MQHEIKVSVVEFGDRPHYQMQWRDPATGRKKTKSTGVERTGRKRKRDEALKAAAKHEAELREGRYHEPNKITWDEFREKYESEVVSGSADTTADKVAGVFNVLERIINPQRLLDLTAQRLSTYQAKLREQGRAEATIKGHLAHLAAALSWGVKMGMLPKMPAIEGPKRAKGQKLMKGRPITLEEFERMLAAVPKVVTPERKKRESKLGTSRPPKPEVLAQRTQRSAVVLESWKHYLRGLWLSGLRLGESLNLYWDRDDKLCVDLSGRRPMLRIPADLEKGNQERLLAIAPEFAEFLLATPQAARTGPVFNPLAQSSRGERISEVRVIRNVSDIGKKAHVKVATDAKSGKVKFASAHDMRRSFGERWAPRVMPQVLMELMRHESIETTLRYYVGRNAQATADVLWEAHARATGTNAGTGNSSGNSAPKTTKAAEVATSESVSQ